MNLLKNIVFVWIQYRHFQAAYAELRRLSDRELSDLGLTRGDIAWVAFAEAERRTEAALATPDGRFERAGEPTRSPSPIEARASWLSRRSADRSRVSSGGPGAARRARSHTRAAMRLAGRGFLWRADQEITRWVPSVTPVAANITSPRARSCRS